MSGICYKKNFLKQVIARVEFAQPLSDLSDSSLLDAVKEIKSRFPIAEQKTAFKQDVQISDQNVTHSKSEFTEWNFHGADRDKSLTLSQHYLQILLTKYHSEDNFQQDLITPISHIIGTRPSTVISRTGIRFINVFDFDGINFNSVAAYFSDYIAAPLEKNKDSMKCTRSFLINEYMEDDIKYRVQTGFFNPDYPAVIKKHHFAIDIDAYIDFPHSISDVGQYFGKFHRIIQTSFESMITDKLRDEVLNA
ncbi:hypothetical protein GALL_22950 [mine drainage metagenome]|uniref:TIGR04255 family protein n=1 Tax=mine drainage metagenome TaxID=410659 RepID=A0A1J5T8Q5_9ZZZZ